MAVLVTEWNLGYHLNFVPSICSVTQFLYAMQCLCSWNATTYVYLGRIVVGAI